MLTGRSIFVFICVLKHYSRSISTFTEVAENFKNQGNEAFKSGREHYQDANTYYTKALEAQCNDMKLIEIVYVNRAAVNLELRE